MASFLFENSEVTSFLEPEFKHCLQKIMTENIQIISALSKPSTTKKKKKERKATKKNCICHFLLPSAPYFFSLLLLHSFCAHVSVSESVHCELRTFRWQYSSPTGARYIDLQHCQTLLRFLQSLVNTITPWQARVQNQKQQQVPHLWEGAGLGSVGDSVTARLIWFLALDFFIGEDVMPNKFLSSGTHDNEMYTLLLFVACLVKCDAQLLIMLENTFRVCSLRPWWLPLD